MAYFVDSGFNGSGFSHRVFAKPNKQFAAGIFAVSRVAVRSPVGYDAHAEIVRANAQRRWEA